GSAVGVEPIVDEDATIDPTAKGGEQHRRGMYRVALHVARSAAARRASMIQLQVLAAVSHDPLQHSESALQLEPALPHAGPVPQTPEVPAPLQESEAAAQLAPSLAHAVPLSGVAPV